MSIYDRMKNQPLMRMQEGGESRGAENIETVDVDVVATPLYPKGITLDEIALRERRQEIDDALYWKQDKNHRDLNAEELGMLSQELNNIDKQLELGEFSGPTRESERRRKVNEGFGDVLKDLRGYEEGGEAMTPEEQALLDKYVQEATNNFLGGTYTTPGIDLGGGLGGVPGVQLNMQDILAQLPQNQMFGIPTVFADPVEDEVLEEQEEDIAPVMPVAPVKDPVVEVVSEEVAEEVAPTPTPTPTPSTPPPSAGIPAAGDMVTQPPRVVLPPTPAEDMNLITGTDAPLTEEEIVNVATPTMTPTTGADIARLNQQYNDTFLKMLVQNPVNAQAAAQANQPVYGPGSNQGDQSGLLGGESISRYAQSPNQSYMAPGITGAGGTAGASMQDMFNNFGNYQQTYSTPADVQFQMGDVFDNVGFGNSRLLNNINNSNQNFNNPYEQYGNLQFPVFGSGVTSLVPQDAINKLYQPSPR